MTFLKVCSAPDELVAVINTRYKEFRLKSIGKMDPHMIHICDRLNSLHIGLATVTSCESHPPEHPMLTIQFAATEEGLPIVFEFYENIRNKVKSWDGDMQMQLGFQTKKNPYGAHEKYNAPLMRIYCKTEHCKMKYIRAINEILMIEDTCEYARQEVDVFDLRNK